MIRVEDRTWRTMDLAMMTNQIRTWSMIRRHLSQLSTSGLILFLQLCPVSPCSARNRSLRPLVPIRQQDPPLHPPTNLRQLQILHTCHQPLLLSLVNPRKARRRTRRAVGEEERRAGSTRQGRRTSWESLCSRSKMPKISQELETVSAATTWAGKDSGVNHWNASRSAFRSSAQDRV